MCLLLCLSVRTKIYDMVHSLLQVAMKEKMLTKLERDRAVGQVNFPPTSVLMEQLTDLIFSLLIKKIHC